MDEPILESLNKVNELRKARIKLAVDKIEHIKRKLSDRRKERRALGTEFEIKDKSLCESIAEYTKIKERIESEGFDKLQARTRKKHLLSFQKAAAIVREWGRANIELRAKITSLDADIERAGFELFEVWHSIARFTLNDYERFRPSKAKLRALSERAARTNAEFRVSQGGYPLHIQLNVETKEALLELPLDVRILDKHLPAVHKVISEYQDLDFERKFLHISYLSVNGLHPEGMILTVKNKPSHPAGNFRKLPTPEIEIKEK